MHILITGANGFIGSSLSRGLLTGALSPETRVTLLDTSVTEVRHELRNELTTAIIGFEKSWSLVPVARHKARALAMLRPDVDVLERYVGM
jgi:nucleoside-diphosphate-sugar epimerase